MGEGKDGQESRSRVQVTRGSSSSGKRLIQTAVFSRRSSFVTAAMSTTASTAPPMKDHRLETASPTPSEAATPA